MQLTRRTRKPEREFGAELKVSSQLLTLIDKTLKATPSLDIKYTRKDQAFAVLASKAVITFEALRLLCLKRFADDAFCLLRTLIEAVVNGKYILIMGDGVAEDYRDFPKYRRWVEYCDLRKVFPRKAEEQTAAEITRMEREHDAVKSRYRRFRKGEWCEHTLFQRARIIDQESRGELNLMQSVINTAWRGSSAYAHASMQSTYDVSYKTSFFGKIEPPSTKDDAANVLFCANFVMLMLLENIEIHIHGKLSQQLLRFVRSWTRRHSRTR